MSLLPQSDRLRQLVLVLSLALPSPALGAGRAIAILEYRAAVRAAPEIAQAMAEQIARLTAHRVLPPDEARRRLGAGLDAEVARCQGDPGCIAVIGGRLGCDEVILVGVSQLGDLIIAIQRIEVASGRVLARLADSVTPGRPLAASDLQRYLRRLLPPADFRRYGRIVIRTNARGDAVFLDDAPRGTTPLRPLRVPAPGRYALRVTRPGHEDFLARLDILPEATVEVTPHLSRRAPPSRWYHQWWVWTLIGGAVAAGTTAAVVLGTSRSDDRVPVVIRTGP